MRLESVLVNGGRCCGKKKKGPEIRVKRGDLRLKRSENLVFQWLALFYNAERRSKEKSTRWAKTGRQDSSAGRTRDPAQHR